MQVCKGWIIHNSPLSPDAIELLGDLPNGCSSGRQWPEVPCPSEIFFPGKRNRSSRIPNVIPSTEAIAVEQTAIVNVTLTALNIFGSDSTFFSQSAIFTTSCYASVPALGVNRACPYSSTPYSPISSCTSSEQIHSIKSFAPSLFTSGYFSGLTAITPY